MSYMFKAIYIFILCVVFNCCLAFAETPNTRMVIDLGLLEEEMSKSQKTPDSIENFPPDKEFGMNETKVARYKGLVLNYHRSKNGFYIWRLEITSEAWAYKNNTISVGTSMEQVKNILGDPESIESNELNTSWFYHLYNYDAWTKITFSNSKVVEIFAAEDWT